jgi:hypothetical protein
VNEDDIYDELTQNAYFRTNKLEELATNLQDSYDDHISQYRENEDWILSGFLRVSDLEKYVKDQLLSYISRIASLHALCHKKNLFKIKREGELLCCIFFPKTFWRLGEDIYFEVNFSEAVIKCYRITIYLCCQSSVKQNCRKDRVDYDWLCQRKVKHILVYFFKK